eukprot:TRINITY_DN24644_c0_g2_i2.p1 TRINITY_DN24644_c0_g2~~TRINITY_DN24644_c0_g2_i2.p1  ORF type:complete len:315 (-),score=74.86 TRINITY_DN24644_c0_g2_i2:36-980(-)
MEQQIQDQRLAKVLLMGTTNCRLHQLLASMCDKNQTPTENENTLARIKNLLWAYVQKLKKGTANVLPDLSSRFPLLEEEKCDLNSVLLNQLKDFQEEVRDKAPHILQKYSRGWHLRFVLDNLERICAEGYVPSTEDFINMLAEPNGMILIRKESYEITAFVDTVDLSRNAYDRLRYEFSMAIFVVNPACFDEKHEDGESVLRRRIDDLQEKVRAFCVGRDDTSVLVLLTEEDLFQYKLKQCKFEDYFPESVSRDPREFIVQRCEEAASHAKNRQVKWSRNTDNLHLHPIDEFVRDMNIKSSLESAGIVVDDTSN